VAFALGTALVLCTLGAFSVAAHAQTADVVRHPRERPIIRVPVVRAPPYWDSYLVPRYRYRPEDDRVDPCGGPVVPVITYGPQEATVPVWVANEWGLGRVHGRDWPCTGQRRYCSGPAKEFSFPTRRHLRLCEYIPGNQKGRQAALPGLRATKIPTGATNRSRWKCLMGASNDSPHPVVDHFYSAFK